MSKNYSDKLLQADIERTRAESKLEEIIFDYHTALIELLNKKNNGDRTDTTRLYSLVKDLFGSMLATHDYFIQKNMSIAKMELERAFYKMGIDENLKAGLIKDIKDIKKQQEPN